ncbi:MAG: DUF5011 domain-containing protein [Erysipelotrichaceae bacterium]|nr:DUF5011 domain-containing protein [Erysipelotrichaceae bacterium]
MHNKIILTILSFFVIVDVGLIYLATHISPMKLKRNTFTFQYGEKIPTEASEYVNATDSVLAEVVLDLSNVSYEVGTYIATATYYSQVETFEIVVVDTVQPKVVLKQVTWEIAIGETIYAADLIDVEDNSETTAYFIDEDTQETSESKTYYTSGSHVERIIVIDEHGNQSTSLRVKITVLSNDTTPPIIYGIEDVTIQLGDTFDELEGVSAYDETDGWITSDIEVDGVINTHIVGVYEIVYSVSDSAGNVTEETRVVSVIDN